MPVDYAIPRCIREKTHVMCELARNGAGESRLSEIEYEKARPESRDLSMYEVLYLYLHAYTHSENNSPAVQLIVWAAYCRRIREFERILRVRDRFMGLLRARRARRIQRWFRARYYSPGGEGYRAALKRFTKTRAGLANR